MKSWSPYQKDIFDFVKSGSGNALVNAVAGSGKTTTIAEAYKLAQGQAIFLAFNKSIAEELKGRGLNARTFHSLTYGPVTAYKGVRSVEANKVRRLCDAKLSGEEARLYGAFIGRLLGLAKQAGIGFLVPDTFDAWMDLCIHHDLEPDNESADMGKGIELAQAMLAHNNESNLVDFDDLLYLAAKEGIALPKFDFVFVDEAQDTNAIQRAILRKIMKPSSRLIAVGDPAQAIYGFRGADSDSLDLIVEEFECKKFPLSISYRCAKSVVSYARTWVDHIEASATAPEGVVEDLGSNWNSSNLNSADLVVCRRTAPLIAMAYKLMRERKPVTVMGREIGQGLIALVRKMGSKNLDQFSDRLENYRLREVEKATAKKLQNKVEQIEDKCDAIMCILDSMDEGERTIENLLLTIEHLFSNKRDAVILATIHKSKGLEADRVFWLERSKCPANWAKQDWQKQQEMNLCYVATTRAKSALYLIEPNGKKTENKQAA